MGTRILAAVKGPSVMLIQGPQFGNHGSKKRSHPRQGTVDVCTCWKLLSLFMKVNNVFRMKYQSYFRVYRSTFSVCAAEASTVVLVLKPHFLVSSVAGRLKCAGRQGQDGACPAPPQEPVFQGALLDIRRTLKSHKVGSSLNSEGSLLCGSGHVCLDSRGLSLSANVVKMRPSAIPVEGLYAPP